MWDDSPGDTDGVPRVDEIVVDFSDIQFEKKIGKGAFGEVWKAQYLGTDVAVKKMFQPEDAWVRKLIKREIEALRAVRHPNVVNYMGTVHHGGDVYLITEYMEGGTLWKLLSNKAKPLPWLTRVNIALDVARAITYLHARNIIHRDLKCRNLLIDRNIRVKVCDFGLCRETNPEQQKFMTKSGTDEWMAPEVILGNPYNAKADSFSFGMVLFEIITREKPPSRDPMRGFEVDPEEISAAIPPECPAELRRLTLDCILSDQNARPTFREILDRLFQLRSRLKPPKKKDDIPLPSAVGTQDLLPPPSPIMVPPEGTPSPTDGSPGPSAAKPRPTATSKRVFKKTVTEGVDTPPPELAPLPPPPIASEAPALPFPLLTEVTAGLAGAEQAKTVKREKRKSAKLNSAEIFAPAALDTSGGSPPPPLAAPVAVPSPIGLNPAVPAPLVAPVPLAAVPPPLPPMDALHPMLPPPPPDVDVEKQKQSKRRSEKKKKDKEIDREKDRPATPPPVAATFVLPPPPVGLPPPAATTTVSPPPSLPLPPAPVQPLTNALPQPLAQVYLQAHGHVHGPLPHGAAMSAPASPVLASLPTSGPATAHTSPAGHGHHHHHVREHSGPHTTQSTPAPVVPKLPTNPHALPIVSSPTVPALLNPSNHTTPVLAPPPMIPPPAFLNN